VFPKATRITSRAVRRAAEGAPCTVQIPGACDGGGATSVLAHLRMLGGGGVGMKPDDIDSVIACDGCHSCIDSRRPMPAGYSRHDLGEMLLRAHCRTVRYLVEQGVMSVKGAK